MVCFRTTPRREPIPKRLRNWTGTKDRWLDLWRQLAGPGLGLVEKTANLAISAAKAPFDDQSNFGRDVGKYIEQFTPGSNIYYARLILQRYVWNNLIRLLDKDPEGYFQRQEESARRWNRGESWFRPGDLAPERLPDTSNLFGD